MARVDLSIHPESRGGGGGGWARAFAPSLGLSTSDSRFFLLPARRGRLVFERRWTRSRRFLIMSAVVANSFRKYAANMVTQRLAASRTAVRRMGGGHDDHHHVHARRAASSARDFRARASRARPARPGDAHRLVADLRRRGLQQEHHRAHGPRDRHRRRRRHLLRRVLPEQEARVPQVERPPDQPCPESRGDPFNTTFPSGGGPGAAAGGGGAPTSAARPQSVPWQKPDQVRR